MSFPVAASWRHQDSRTGLEVAFFQGHEGGRRISGATTAVEDGESWFVEYAIAVDAAWHTRRAEISGRSAAGTRHTVLESDGDGRWRVDGVPDPRLDGCFDVDLAVERLEQTYERVGDRDFAYTAPVFDFSCLLSYDEHLLVVDYPGIATRLS